MKVRTGFVSNSSSSSFVCDVSGEIESGWDMTIAEAGMCACENNHYFLEEFLVGEVAEAKDKENDYFWDWRVDIPSANCPICTMTHISDGTLLKYITKTNGIDLEKIKDDIRQRYGNHKELMDSLEA